MQIAIFVAHHSFWTIDCLDADMKKEDTDKRITEVSFFVKTHIEDKVYCIFHSFKKYLFHIKEVGWGKEHGFESSFQLVMENIIRGWNLLLVGVGKYN